MSDSNSAVPAVDRADTVLQVLASSSEPVSPADLALHTGLAKSTLYLLLTSLEQRRWIEKKGSGYVIGIGLYMLGCAYVHFDNLQHIFRTVAAEFVTAHNEVVQLAVLQGGEVVYLAREDAHRPVRLVSDIGTRLPAHACALGKALLAQLSDKEVLRLLPQELVAITDRTITRHEVLLSELATVRRSGLALDLEEVAAGLNCFAVYAGETPMGRRIAVSTSIPTDRLGQKREKAIVQAIVRVAEQVKQRLSARG
ncbi:IclR family transcriptional regulator [Pusillimonas sp. T7-7]|uniref:IclR family transcriptional regulator n=1 Tax=Pusillimonas sp. (strain T7-7) TaxID=1007105 RepID=UPI00020851BD|nr:IclR family transcriptional regulator [Pusillimonas sp. T7-7]AEC20706.1 IclR family transcriptional regulator [Pusillimonas sp. T7-7]